MTLLGSLARGLRAITSPFVDLMIPPTCAACDRAVGHGVAVCDSCASSLAGVAACTRCGMFLGPGAKETDRCNGCTGDPPAFTRLVAAAAYDDAARTIVHRLKFAGRTSLAAFMANAMIARWQAIAPGTPACVIPVPSVRARHRERGFNPAALLAKPVARALGVSIAEPLIATDEVAAPQHGLSRAARLTAAVHRFAVRDARQTVPGSVLLVDDVATTLSTAHACSALLRELGATRVYVLTFARVTA